MLVSIHKTASPNGGYLIADQERGQASSLFSPEEAAWSATNKHDSSSQKQLSPTGTVYTKPRGNYTRWLQVLAFLFFVACATAIAWKVAATREAAVPAGSPAPAAAAAVQVAAASPSVLAFAEGALAVKDTKRRLFYYASAPPATSPPALLVVCVPGLLRDVASCFAQSAAAVAGARAVVVTPYFACNSANNVFRKTCLAGELCWSACNGFAENDDPTTGSDSPATITDNLILEFRKKYPTINNVVGVGFSLGAQFINHYAAITTLPNTVPIRFLFASASGYLYFDAKRLTLKGDFVNYPSSDCPDFNDWKYGILGYPGPGKASDLAPRFLSRDITIIALKADNECGSSTGSGCSCEITAQSNGLEDRFILGQAYYNYLVKVHKKTAGLFYKEIPSCTHDAYCFFANVDVQAAIFSRGPVTPSIPKAA
ncbi:hypothetical protein BDR26DRAFT_1014835 [Obelidium mucronatum]|nr:hypothetical protein BDR26DRAFT_1014835 [Obelidium mucronatum]